MWRCWILRSQLHARDAFTPITNRLAAGLRDLLWAVRSLRDLHIDNCKIWSDSAGTIEAISNKEKWPLFRSYLDQIHSSFIRARDIILCILMSSEFYR